MKIDRRNKAYIEMNTFSAFLHIPLWSCKRRHAMRSLFTGIGKISLCAFKRFKIILDSEEKATFIHKFDSQ